MNLSFFVFLAFAQEEVDNRSKIEAKKYILVNNIALPKHKEQKEERSYSNERLLLAMPFGYTQWRSKIVPPCSSTPVDRTLMGAWGLQEQYHHFVEHLHEAA